MVPIRLANLSKEFTTPRGTVAAAVDVCLTVQSGELFFLLGPSGCGKTTLLRTVAGFIEPTKGRVFFGDRDVTDLPPERRDAAMVFQNYALWPHMTVADNVSFGPKVRGVPARRRQQLVAQLLATVRIAERATARPMELSGGQQQRVALARALAAEPKCLLLDEPLSNLDAALRAAMRWEIRRIVKSSGITAIYVTHDQAEALAIADRIALMRQGRIVQIGTGRELYEAPASRFVAEFIGEGNFLPAAVAGVEGSWVLLDTPLGRLRGRCTGDLRSGQEVTCCIRPECLRIGPGGAGEAELNRFTARLLEWVHLGEAARFRLESPRGVQLSGAAMPARPVAATGQDLSVAVASEDVTVLPR